MYDIDIRGADANGVWVVVKKCLYGQDLNIHMTSVAHLQTLIALLQEIDNFEVE